MKFIPDTSYSTMEYSPRTGAYSTSSIGYRIEYSVVDVPDLLKYLIKQLWNCEYFDPKVRKLYLRQGWTNFTVGETKDHAVAFLRKNNNRYCLYTSQFGPYRYSYINSKKAIIIRFIDMYVLHPYKDLALTYLEAHYKAEQAKAEERSVIDL